MFNLGLIEKPDANDRHCASSSGRTYLSSNNAMPMFNFILRMNKILYSLDDINTLITSTWHTSHQNWFLSSTIADVQGRCALCNSVVLCRSVQLSESARDVRSRPFWTCTSPRIRNHLQTCKLTKGLNIKSLS
jgi:hypothetical protein